MGSSQNSFVKRQRELARNDKRKAKAAKKAKRAFARTVTQDGQGDIDPDIAHIIPGPQPVPWDEGEDEEPADDRED